MSEINVFNERHLKDHPLYSDIHSAFFHHNTNRKCYQNMMGYLQALANDSEYWQEPQQEAIERPAKPSKEEGKKSAMNPIIFISHRTTCLLYTSPSDICCVFRIPFFIPAPIRRRRRARFFRKVVAQSYPIRIVIQFSRYSMKGLHLLPLGSDKWQV